MKMSDGGKGSAPRLNQDLEAYSEGHERIFGKSKLQLRLEQEMKNTIEPLVDEQPKKLEIY